MNKLTVYIIAIMIACVAITTAAGSFWSIIGMMDTQYPVTATFHEKHMNITIYSDKSALVLSDGGEAVLPWICVRHNRNVITYRVGDMADRTLLTLHRNGLATMVDVRGEWH